ncbi:hypothetical protein LV457_00510 [Mycobacterium sp. MYCO198283]|uniref:hypothetical protein n=1 Tax=Mycobacterium sp. MYCO198283 TaxID=2883505 RepID=UPI001E2A3E9F|nr:hypothetical protein [Mycobacterium sp. MYCO198283]MCG5430781.1 hypothetical protein [Mycobacterium sp. MYCO198283]
MMRRLLRLVVTSVAVSVGAPLFVAAAPAHAANGVILPFSAFPRRCDWSTTAVSPRPAQTGSGTAVVNSDGHQVSADITFLGGYNLRFEARLIQVPRPTSAPCNSGADPGVAAGVLQLNDVGQGSLTLRDTIEPGATGVWVYLFQPSDETQQVTQFFSSDLIAPV